MQGADFFGANAVLCRRKISCRFSIRIILGAKVVMFSLFVKNALF
ncbi:hypothetical protein HMPREF9996_00234 [Aggregatibacter actinomycetemcomitans Y4]|nr:hypothetical protein HMPREF9996_00234 [Aggregatibacter actinomycetemcomitans Y4]